MKTVNLRSLIFLYGAATAGATAAQELKLGVGLDCSSGKYGQTETTTVCMVPYSLQAFIGAYEFKILLPYFDVKEDPNAKGLGDASLYAAKTVFEEQFGIDALEVGLKVKGRNGSVERGLGSGRTAFSAGVGLTQFFGARHLYLAYAGLTSGSRPDNRTGAYATLWYKYLAGADMKIGLLYENNEIGYAKRMETITLMPEFTVARRWTLKPFIYTGINNFAPDWGIGLVSTYNLR